MPPQNVTPPITSDITIEPDSTHLSIRARRAGSAGVRRGPPGISTYGSLRQSGQSRLFAHLVNVDNLLV